MDCFGRILDKFCNCFLFDGIWWKDYGIPLLGAVAIPLLVWFLTWYYGADKAEKRKEMRELRDNLNLLLSICKISIKKAISYRNLLIDINNMETSNCEDETENYLCEISRTFCLYSDFNEINTTKYTSLVAFDSEFVDILLTAKNAMDLLLMRIEARNNIIKRITNSDKKEIKKDLELFLVCLDLDAYKENIDFVDKTLLLLKSLLDKVKDIENKIGGILLNPITFLEEENKLLAELEQKYNKELKND